MTSVIIWGFVAGVLAGGGLPHFVSGIMGKAYQTPFGKPNSPGVNVVWGWLNWVVAVLVWHIAPMRLHPRAAFVATALGVLLVGLMLTYRVKGSQHSK